MYVRALRGKEKAWGAEHTSTLDTVHNLGNLYKNQGKMAEAVPRALRAVNDREKGPCFRACLMLDFLAAMGTKDQIKGLAPLLSDDSGLGSLQVGDGPVLAPQVRDVALAVSIRLAGQKPADFGFHAGAFDLTDFQVISDGTTAYLRVKAGKHFPTDVIVGAVIGSAVGYAVVSLHKMQE